MNVPILSQKTEIWYPNTSYISQELGDPISDRILSSKLPSVHILIPPWLQKPSLILLNQW